MTDMQIPITKQRKKYGCIIAIVFGVLLCYGFFYVVFLGGCTGGIDGHWRHLSDEAIEQCLFLFPRYDFPYKT